LYPRLIWDLVSFLSYFSIALPSVWLEKCHLAASLVHQYRRCFDSVFACIYSRSYALVKSGAGSHKSDGYRLWHMRSAQQHPKSWSVCQESADTAAFEYSDVFYKSNSRLFDHRGLECTQTSDLLTNGGVEQGKQYSHAPTLAVTTSTNIFCQSCLLPILGIPDGSPSSMAQ
jgi:hypothetical protein